MSFYTTVVFILFAASGIVCAEDVLDLGSLEIEGEVRRPMLQYLESTRNAEDVYRDLVLWELKEYERKLSEEKEESHE